MQRGNNLSTIIRIYAFGFFLLLALTSFASAHASLTKTAPVDGSVIDHAPQNFSLAFSEPVSPLALKLIRPDGSADELEQFALHDQTLDIIAPTDLSDGTHVLTWRVVSSDGHPVAGSVVFSIGAPSASPPHLTEQVNVQLDGMIWLAKLLLYITLFIGIGGAFSIIWLWPKQKPARNFICIILMAGFIIVGLSLGLQGLDALGYGFKRFFDHSIWKAGIDTSYSQSVFSLLLAIIIAISSLFITNLKHARLLSLAAVFIGAFALALSGHASAATPQWLTRPSVFIHAITITLWVGALLPLCTALYRNTSDLTTGLHRFSNFIPYALLLLVIAGITLTIIQVQKPSALFNTAYGQLLLTKLAILVFLFLLAAYNRWKLTEPVMKSDRSSSSKLARAILIETLLLILVFGVASGWRFTPPPRSIAIAAAQPAEVHIHSDKAMAEVKITPGHTGSVVVSAVLMNEDFAPLEAQEVTFVFSNSDAGIEPFSRKASKTQDGNWQSNDVLLPLAGTWKVRLDILINDFEIARLEENIEIKP
ncbi:copper resistance CopC/CopD family protein [Brucellaceae bacterium C25G]